MESRESLIRPADASASAAPSFNFSEFEALAEDRLSIVGEYSGERLFARRPEVYRAIVSMLAEGLGTTIIAKACQVSPNTIYAVRNREGITIESERKELLRNLRQAAKLSVEKTLDLLPSLKNAKDAAITAAVMIDKLQLLSGEATSRIEKIEVDQDSLLRMVSCAPILEGEFTQITGPLAGAPGQRGPGLLAGAGASDLVADGEKLPSVDIESTVSRHSPMVAAGMVATLVASSEDISALDGHCDQAGSPGEDDNFPMQGAGGVGFPKAPPIPPTGLGEEKFSDKGGFGDGPASIESNQQ